MKLLLLFALCAVASAAVVTNNVDSQLMEVPEDLSKLSAQERNLLLNTLIRQLWTYLRHVINNGSRLLGVPPTDPLVIDHLRFNVPAGLINLELEVLNGLAEGLGGFVVDRSVLNLRAMTFDVEITIPRLDISADLYDLVGDLYRAIPLYGKGCAKFEVENFKLRGLFHIKQAGDAIVIDRLENPGFEMPHLKTKLTGVIGGGDIDDVVNAIVNDVVVDYVNRFSHVITKLVAPAIVHVANPVLEKLDTWKYISPFV